MVEIIKKIQQKYFQAILNGDKTFELRLADQEYNIGDILVLKEINENREFTGREIKKQITWIANTKNETFWPKEDIAKFGLIILGFK
jgi:hypothetical protein